MTAATDEDLAQEVGALTRTILADLAAPEGDGIDRPVWQALSESGLTSITTETGGGWPEIAALLTQVGAHAARVPVAEHELLGGWLGDLSGLVDPADTGICTAGLVVDGVARDVPWARHADTVFMIGRGSDNDTRVWCARAGELDLTPMENLAGEPRDLVIDGRADAGVEIDPAVIEEFRLRLSLARTLQIGGAAAAVLELVVGYSGEREQFGRPIAKFQAVQELVSAIAAESALISISGAGAVDQVSRLGLDDERARIATLVAASCAAHGAATIVRNAHQVLGAMGYTKEHPLHRFTNRMLSWRGEARSVRETDLALLRALGGRERTEVWSLLVDAGATPQTAERK